MKKIRIGIGLIAAVFAISVSAQTPPPIVLVPTPGVDPDCIGSYVGVAYVTNNDTDGIWFYAPNGAGPATASVTGWSDLGIKVTRNDAFSVACSTSNQVSFQVSTNLARKYKFTLYFYSLPPTNTQLTLIVDWPAPWLEVTSVEWPSGTNRSKVTFNIHAPATNALYQLWYTQALPSGLASTNWIGHSIFYGQANDFTRSETAHITYTNRPTGFWQIRSGTGVVTNTSDYTVEHVDPPLDYPLYVPCTNCPPGGGPTPPGL